MQRYSSDPYRKYTLTLLGLAAVAVILTAAAMAFRRNAVQTVGQSHIDNYISKPAASQGNAASQTVFRGEISRPAASPIPVSSPSPSPVPSPTAAPAKKESYVVTIHKGKIGVFEAGKTEPFLTADVDVYLLPEKDVALLRKGIPAESLSQVKGILEDYR